MSKNKGSLRMQRAVWINWSWRFNKYIAITMLKRYIALRFSFPRQLKTMKNYWLSTIRMRNKFLNTKKIMSKFRLPIKSRVKIMKAVMKKAFRTKLWFIIFKKTVSNWKIVYQTAWKLMNNSTKNIYNNLETIAFYRKS
jgi:hypothetical protein